MLRWFLRVLNLLFSQIAGHLNKVPIKIQSLSLLPGSGSDRQHEHWLFRFQHKELEERLTEEGSGGHEL